MPWRYVHRLSIFNAFWVDLCRTACLRTLVKVRWKEHVHCLGEQRVLCSASHAPATLYLFVCGWGSSWRKDAEQRVFLPIAKKFTWAAAKGSCKRCAIASLPVALEPSSQDWAAVGDELCVVSLRLFSSEYDSDFNGNDALLAVTGAVVFPPNSSLVHSDQKPSKQNVKPCALSVFQSLAAILPRLVRLQAAASSYP